MRIRLSDTSAGEGWGTAGADSDSDTDGGENEEVNDVLVVRVVKARGLLPSDSNGLSDPYVSIKFLRQKKKTKVVRKSLNPEWNESFEFKAKRRKDSPNTLDHEMVTFILKDKDFFFDDMLGVVELPIWGILEKAKRSALHRPSSLPEEDFVDPDLGNVNLVDADAASVASAPEANELKQSDRQSSTAKIRSYVNRFVRRYSSEEGKDLSYSTFSTGPRWYPLERAPGMKTVQGAVKLDIIYYKAVAFSSFPTPLSVVPQESDSGLEEDRAEVMHFDGRPKVRISVLRARNIPISDMNGLSDPYVVLSCRGTRHRTATRQKTLNPVWNEEFTFGDKSDYLVQRDVISIKIYDKDLITSLPICSMELPLWVIDQSTEEPQWYRLEHLTENIPAPVKLLHHDSSATESFGEIQLKASLTGESEQNRQVWMLLF